MNVSSKPNSYSIFIRTKLPRLLLAWVQFKCQSMWTQITHNFAFVQSIKLYIILKDDFYMQRKKKLSEQELSTFECQF